MMQDAKTRLFSLKWGYEFLFNKRCLKLSFYIYILFMFLGHTNPNLKLCVSVTAIVVQ